MKNLNHGNYFLKYYQNFKKKLSHQNFYFHRWVQSLELMKIPCQPVNYCVNKCQPDGLGPI
ncbi:hypothetical protein HanIR_Chr16g0819531 [Helianthus annuus]|nr:hypothetical protein HanIR_Chr16g0819531 [Helianthus annuus]